MLKCKYSLQSIIKILIDKLESYTQLDDAE